MSTSSDFRRLTVVVPALNEEHALGPTLDKLLVALPKYWKEWEILIFNDGSTDQTGSVAEKYVLSHPSRIQAFHHEKPLSLGVIFKKGLKLSRYEHLIMVHGQNDIRPETLEALFSVQGVDLVIPYQANRHERPLPRRWLSVLFVFLLNRTFRLRLRYYNHYVLYRKELLEGLPFRALGYAFQAELLIKLLKWKECSFMEIPVMDDFSSKKQTKAFRAKNICFIFKFYLAMIKDVYGTKSQKPFDDPEVSQPTSGPRCHQG